MTGLHIAVDGSGLARPWAGVGTYTTEILQALAAARPQNRFTVYVAGEGASVAGQPGIAVRKLPTTRLIGRHVLWPARLRRLRAAAYFGPAGQIPLSNVGAPAVVTAHDMAIYRHPEWFPSGQALSVRLVVPRSMMRAAAIVAVSRNTAGDVMELFDVPASRVEVVAEGVSPRFRPLPQADLEEARARLGLPERFVLFMGTIEPRKNLVTLLEAWSQMPGRPPLVVAGGWGWHYEAVKERMEKLEGVQLLGPVASEHQPALYGLAACLAHPAWYEGFGLTPLEAMACGTPVVASNASSLPEVVGEAGLLVAPDDVEGWTAALSRVCEDLDLHGELRQRGLLRAAELTWQRAADRTWRVLERVARSAAG